MQKLTLTSNNYSSSISVPTWFIRNLMPDAMGGYVKVYLFLLAEFYEGQTLSLKDIATSLSMLTSEVISAIEYWEEKELLKLNKSSTNNFELSFNFQEPESIKSTKSTKSPKSLGSIKTKKPSKKKETREQPYIQQNRPNYSPSEISIYLHNPEVKQLYKIAEKSLGRLLSSSDQQILFGLYDWLHMPLELVEYLLDYCASRGHTNMRYIEKTAITWADEGINTLELAKTKEDNDKIYFKILSEVGLGTKSVTTAQKKSINKWLYDYKLSLELILEGCRRTSLQTQNPSLNYLDTIFKSWHKNKVSTLEDIEKLDKAFASKKQLQPSGNFKAKSKTKKTSFNTLEGRDWDFSELERLERDRMNRLLNEGS